MKLLLVFLLLSLSGASYAVCPKGKLLEETKCRLELMEDAEKIFSKHLAWLKEVDGILQKMLKEEAACRGFKTLYPTISSNSKELKEKIKKNINSCDGAYKAHWLSRLKELSKDTIHIKAWHDKMKDSYEANKLEVALLEREYEEILKNKTKMENLTK